VEETTVVLVCAEDVLTGIDVVASVDLSVTGIFVVVVEETVVVGSVVVAVVVVVKSSMSQVSVQSFSQRTLVS